MMNDNVKIKNNNPPIRTFSSNELSVIVQLVGGFLFLNKIRKGFTFRSELAN